MKDRFAYTDVDSNFGYQGMEVERLDPASMPDLKESFTMRNLAAVAPQERLWPAGDFRSAALELHRAAVAVARKILSLLATCLDLPTDFFNARHRGENITLRYLHYPAGLAARSHAQLGAGAHTDYGSITLLLQDDVGGLEVRSVDGQWRTAIPVPDTIVINAGDLMERWTNGRFRSTLHRVRPVRGPAIAIRLRCSSTPIRRWQSRRLRVASLPTNPTVTRRSRRVNISGTRFPPLTRPAPRRP